MFKWMVEVQGDPSIESELWEKIRAVFSEYGEQGHTIWAKLAERTATGESPGDTAAEQQRLFGIMQDLHGEGVGTPTGPAQLHSHPRKGAENPQSGSVYERGGEPPRRSGDPRSNWSYQGPEEGEDAEGYERFRH